MSCCVTKLAVRDRVLSVVRWMGSVQTGPMNLCSGWGSQGLHLVDMLQVSLGCINVMSDIFTTYSGYMW